MMMNVTSVVVFCFFYETKAKDNNERASSLSFIFSCITEDNDEPPHSSSSSAILGEKKHKNLLAHYHPLQPKKKTLDVGFSWVAGDNNKPPDLSLSFSFFPHL